MSQRKENYSKNLKLRMDALEDRVEQINLDVIRHGVRLSMVEELNRVMATPAHVAHIGPARSLDALVSEIRTMSAGDICTEYLAGAPTQHRLRFTGENDQESTAEHCKQGARSRRLLLAAVLTMIAAACLICANSSETANKAQQPVTTEASPVVVTIQNAVDAADLPKPEQIASTLLAQGYFSDDVPLPYDWQDTMRTACVKYGCPYPLALAVAEIESQFNVDAVGAVGEVGIMQLNPGPGGSYHADLETATGQDPTTPSGNIVCGVYQLGKYIEKYEDPAKAAMAYNMGESGARKAWATGITSTAYSAAVLAAIEKWECLVST